MNSTLKLREGKYIVFTTKLLNNLTDLNVLVIMSHTKVRGRHRENSNLQPGGWNNKRSVRS